MKPGSGKFDKLCIQNPFAEKDEHKMEACLDWEKLSKEEYMILIRQVLLFMVVNLFITGIVVTLRQY